MSTEEVPFLKACNVATSYTVAVRWAGLLFVDLIFYAFGTSRAQRAEWKCLG